MLDKIPKQDPFKVPEHYFEDLTNQIHQQAQFEVPASYFDTLSSQIQQKATEFEVPVSYFETLTSRIQDKATEFHTPAQYFETLTQSIETQVVAQQPTTTKVYWFETTWFRSVMVASILAIVGLIVLNVMQDEPLPSVPSQVHTSQPQKELALVEPTTKIEALPLDTGKPKPNTSLQTNNTTSPSTQYNAETKQAVEDEILETEISDEDLEEFLSQESIDEELEF